MSIVATTLVDALSMFKSWIVDEGRNALETGGFNATEHTLRQIRSGTLTGITKNLIVEPTIITTPNVRNSKVFDNLVSLNINLFTSFYIQAFQILSDVLGQRPIEAIDILSTNKYTGAAMERYTRDKVYDFLLNKEALDTPMCLGDIDFTNPIFLLNQEDRNELKTLLEYTVELDLNMEGKNNGLSMQGRHNQVYNNRVNTNQQINAAQQAQQAQQANANASQNNNQNGNNGKGNNNNNNTTLVDKVTARSLTRERITDRIDMYRKQADAMYESLNQILVRSINVKARRVQNDGKNGNKKVDNDEYIIPITIVGTIKVVPVEEIIVAVSNYDYKKSFSYRYREWRSGGISLADLVFASDLIQEYKKNKLSKDSKLMSDIEMKKRASGIRQTVTGTIGAEVSYNMIQVTDYELEMIEKAYNKKLDSYNNRNAFLKVLNAHNLSVVDDDAERVQIFISDIQGSMDVGFNKLMKREDKDINMLELFRAMSNNTAPRF